MDELIQKFSFSHCSRSGARFDFEKGKWFNHKYLQEMDDKSLAELFIPVLRANGVNPDDFRPDYIERAISLVKSRINFVKDLWEQGRFFFVEPTEYAPKDVKKRWSEDMPRIMKELIDVLKGLEDFSSAAAEPIVLGWIKENGYHTGNVMNAFRLAVVGECKGPHMFDISELMGLDETVKRINTAIEKIQIPN